MRVESDELFENGPGIELDVQARSEKRAHGFRESEMHSLGNCQCGSQGLRHKTKVFRPYQGKPLPSSYILHHFNL